MQERTQLEKQFEEVRGLEAALEDAFTLAELGDAEGDEATVDEALAELGRLRDKVEKLQIEGLLSGEADKLACYLEVHAGAGGTEAQDWAEMIVRMYARWAERRGYKVEWLEESSGEEAGLKSATLQIAATMRMVG